MSVVTGPDNQREEKISSLIRRYEKGSASNVLCIPAGQRYGAGRRSGDVF